MDASLNLGEVLFGLMETKITDEKQKIQFQEMFEKYKTLEKTDKLDVLLSFSKFIREVSLEKIPIRDTTPEEKEAYLNEFEMKISELFSKHFLTYLNYSFYYLEESEESEPNHKDRFDYCIKKYSEVDEFFENLNKVISYRIF